MKRPLELFHSRSMCKRRPDLASGRPVSAFGFNGLRLYGRKDRSAVATVAIAITVAVTVLRTLQSVLPRIVGVRPVGRRTLPAAIAAAMIGMVDGARNIHAALKTAAETVVESVGKSVAARITGVAGIAAVVDVARNVHPALKTAVETVVESVGKSAAAAGIAGIAAAGTAACGKKGN